MSLMSLRRFRVQSLTLALLTAVGLLLTALGSTTPAHARKKKEDSAASDKSDKKDDKKDDDSPFKDWDKTLKETESLKGLFTLYRKHDNVWVEIKPDQLDKP